MICGYTLCSTTSLLTSERQVVLTPLYDLGATGKQWGLVLWKDKVVQASLVRLTVGESKYYQFFGIKTTILVLGCWLFEMWYFPRWCAILLGKLLIRALVKMDVRLWSLSVLQPSGPARGRVSWAVKNQYGTQSYISDYIDHCLRPIQSRTPAPFGEEVLLLLWESGEGVECVAVTVYKGK